MRMVSKSAGDWDAIRRSFRWRVPARFNMGRAVCDRYARDRSRFALFYEDEQGNEEKYTFWELQQQANRFANVLAAMGVRKGDRVGIILPQRPETAISHIALYKIGAIAVPLAVLFQEDALRFRLSDSGAKAVVVDKENLPKVHKTERHQVKIE